MATLTITIAPADGGLGETRTFTGETRATALRQLASWMQERLDAEDDDLASIAISATTGTNTTVELFFSDVSEEPRYRTKPLRWVIWRGTPEKRGRSEAFDAEDREDSQRAIRRFCAILSADGPQWADR